MYAASIVDSRMGLAAEHLGFRLERHTPAEIDAFEAQLERNHPKEYTQARRAAQGSEYPSKDFQIVLNKLLCNPMDPKLTRAEVRFIRNERALCMSDAAYFLTRYYWILTDEGHIQRFKFRSGQTILFNCIAELESLLIAIEILLAKARQLGMTTLVAGLLLLKIIFSHGCSAVTASADDDKTKEMVSKLFLAYDHLPWWLGPVFNKRSEGAKGYLKFGTINSGIIFQHGQQTNPIAMGTTIIGYHLSEVSSYADPEDLIEVGLFKAVHPNPRILGILEATCKGDTGWWADSYWDAKTGWPKNESRLMALFLPFYCAADMYPNETERRGHPVPEGWEPIEETRIMMAESMMYVASNAVLSKVLAGGGRPWELSREQAFYWEWNFKSAKRKGTEKSWYQEMPHTDKAAFQGSYDNVFGKPVIAEIFTARQVYYDVFGIVGQSIEDRHEPDVRDIDYGTPDEPMVRVPVRLCSHKGEIFRWELVPLQWSEPFIELSDIRDDTSHMGKFFQFLPPEPSYDYAVGIDTSNGIGSDGTCISVSRRGRNGREPDVQAAEFRDNKVSHVEAFAWGAAITAYYSRYMHEDYGWLRAYRNPYVSIEQIAAVGDTCQLQMRKLGISRFHRMTRYDSIPKKMRKKDSFKEGWYTNTWSRPILTDTFVILVQNGWYQLNSAYTIWEADHWEVHILASGKNKFEHGEDSTDDGLFANALCAFCPNDMRSLADRTAKQFRQDSGKSRPVLDTNATQLGYSITPPWNDYPVRLAG